MDILLIFLRNPVPGQVKTRLARTVGNAEALRIYLLLLERTRTAALGAAARRWLCYTDFADYDDAWPNAFFEKKVQHSGDLGQRMAAAFREAFEAGAERVVIIGSDCPQLDGAALQAAFEQLHQADFVLGPVPDGGYYLLGMKQYTPGVFEGIAWSTDTVRAETLHRIGQLGATCALLPMLADVDTEQDWLDWQACQ